jgi:hypothetical protein
LSTPRIPSSSPKGVMGGSWAKATSSASAMWSGRTRCVVRVVFVVVFVIER